MLNKYTNFIQYKIGDDLLKHGANGGLDEIFFEFKYFHIWWYYDV